MNYVRRRCAVACALPLLAVIGCGGADAGGGGLFGSGVDNGKEFGGNAQSASKYRDTLTSDEAFHLLRRAAFGATPDQVANAVRTGLSATVDDLLRTKPVPSTLTALEETFEDDIPRRWLVHLIESPNPLHEKLALFWHDRFATSRRVLSGRDRGLSVLHWNMIRANALGNYRSFLQELTIDPLMLIWLDGANSPKQNPNENYAREFWELFTLGRDTLYTENDIKESARAFTGITLLRESDLDARPIFDLLNHDETDKTIFPGRTGRANYNYLSMIDLTLEQPEAANYVARNMFMYFVHDNPSDALVQSLADTFRQANYEIAPLVRRILTSQAMFSEQARSTHVTSPVEHAVALARTLNVRVFSEESQTGVLERLARDLRDAGQELLNPPGVQGWGENKFWLEDQRIINRVSALRRVMEMEFGPNHEEDLPFDLLPSRDRWDQRDIRNEIVDTMAGVFHLKLSEEERAIYVEVLDQNGWRAFHLEEPDRQPQHVFELIRLMAMHEGFIGR